MTNRNGDVVSAQVSVMGALNIASENFTKADAPFCIKNDGEVAVTLEVNLWGMDEDDYVSTRFEVGWNPEVVRSVKKNTSVTNGTLFWGY